MERTQFTFYESFYRALSHIKSAESKTEAYDAICRYALYGETPDMDAIAETAAMVFELVRPNLDASRRKAESGKRGGAASKTEADKSKLTQSKSKKENENKKKKENEHKCDPPTPLSETEEGPKVQCAENVTMTNAEYQRLLATHGEADTKRLIEILDNYKGSSGKKYKSDYRAIMSWCVDRLGEEKAKKPSGKGIGPYAESASKSDDKRAMIERMERQFRAMGGNHGQQS